MELIWTIKVLWRVTIKSIIYTLCTTWNVCTQIITQWKTKTQASTQGIKHQRTYYVLNKDNVPSQDQQICSLFQSVNFFLNEKPIGDSVLLEFYEKNKKPQGIGTVKPLVVIQLAGYIHLKDHIAPLWATVLKGTTGPANFFSSESHMWDFANYSDLKIAHSQCLSKEKAHVPKRSKINTHCPIMYGNDSTSSINNRNDLVTKEDQICYQFNIVLQKYRSIITGANTTLTMLYKYFGYFNRIFLLLFM